MNASLGYMALFGGILSVAISPLAELLPLSGLQLSFLRGLPGVIAVAVLAFFLRKKEVLSLPDKNTFLLSVCFAMATLGVFSGIKEWGASLTIILLDLAVFIPILFQVRRGEKVGRTVLYVFGIAFFGSCLSLRLWDTNELVIGGLLWSLVALLFNGLFMEFAGRSKQNMHTKVFWLSIAVSLIGLFGFSGGCRY